MRISMVTAALAALATAACVNQPRPVVMQGGSANARPAPRAPPQAETPLDLPASFGGVLPGTEGVEVVLLDPHRFALVRQAGVLRDMRHGSWRREGDLLLLGEGADGVFTVAAGGDELRLEAEQAAAQPAPALRRRELPRLVSGTVKRSGQELVFTPCGGEQARVSDVSGRVGEELGQRRGAVFLEALVSTRDDEFLAWDLQRLAPESQGCRQVRQGLVARATGNEPSWSLELDTRSLRLDRLGREPVGAPWAPFRWEGGAYRYRADTGTEQWEVSLAPTLCRDTMADDVFAYQARVIVNGEELRGCAYLGTKWQLLDGSNER